MPRKRLKNIFLSSIHQNAGKTTMSVGLFKVFQERRIKTAFLKPVGQEVVNIGERNIDKDSYLIGSVFRIGRRYHEMNPVTIGRGYTEKYIFNPHKEQLQSAIEQSFHSLTKGKDAIIVEGTGHAGVGSVIDFSNADVAKLLGSKVIIVSEGGIGKCIDEVILNKGLFDLRGVEVLGVIVNKVMPEKFQKVKRALTQGFENKGIRLLGIVPVDPLLSAPTVEQVRDRLNLRLLCGRASIRRRIKDTIVAAMEPHNMIHYLKDGTLVITSGDRVDNILLAVSSHVVGDGRSFQISGIILTGGLKPNPEIIDLLKKSHIPVMLTREDTYAVAAKIEHLVCKIQKTDKDKIEEATQLVKEHIDYEYIINNA
ncbi:MAG TPA: AAA family ATPase [Candidatus Omnitrophota bacterium]|nr:AAA family ATPase [Candidatus Omnitrophota bacterium]